jgi:hypothetical protein
MAILPILALFLRLLVMIQYCCSSISNSNDDISDIFDDNDNDSKDHQEQQQIS